MPSGFSTSPSYYVEFLQQFAVRRCPRDTPPSQDVDGWTSITSKPGRRHTCNSARLGRMLSAMYDAVSCLNPALEAAGGMRPG